MMEKRWQRRPWRFADHHILGEAPRIAFFLIALFFGYRYGIQLALHTHISPLWIPGAVLLCALLWAPSRWWPLLLAATIPLRLSAIVLPLPIWAVAAATLTDCGKCVLAAVLLRHVLHNPIRFTSVRDFVTYCFVAVFLTSLLGAALGAFVHTGLQESFWQSWEHWFWGDAVANLVIPPFIFYWVLSPTNWRRIAARQGIEATLLLCGLLFSNWLAFTPDSANTGFLATRSFLPIIFLAWAALRFGVTGAAGAIALLTVFAVKASLSQHSYLFSEDTPEASVTDMQYFLLLHAVPLFLVAILIDASRRNQESLRQSARSLRESELRFRTTADTTPVFIWMTDADNLCCFLNKEGLGFTGRTFEQQRGRNWIQDVSSDDIQKLEPALRAIADQKPLDSEFRIRRHDGQHRWLLSRGVPRYGQSGEFLGYIGSSVDVTERKQVEDALRAKQHQLERITNSAPVLIIQCSRDLRYVFANSAFAKLVGKPIDQIVGRPIVEVVGEVAFRVIKPYIERVLAGERVKWERETQYPATGTRYMDIEYVPDVDSNGAIVGWIGTLSDVTERKRAEQNLREKDQFLAMLAHELRAPLAPISAGIEVLQREPDIETLESTLPLLLHQTRHMVRLVDDLLDVSRVSLGKIELKMERIELRSVIEPSVECARLLIEDKGHHLTVSVEPEPFYVFADSDRLVQVLCNLLNNACKYMDRGGSIALTVERDGRHALIRVRDRGIGIASEDIPRIFELFAQVDTSLDRSVGGLGIGLTLARSVIEKHGGRLEAFSAGVGQGSEFVTRLPLAMEAPRQRESTLSEAAVLERRQVLIVDDSAMTTKALARLLRTGGHVVHVAHDGLEGLEAARTFRPDVILLDIGLPKLDGYETCRCIRNEPWGGNIRVVALTGYGRPADISAARGAGFDHFLLKPITYRNLTKVFAGLPCGEDKLAAFREEETAAAVPATLATFAELTTQAETPLSAVSVTVSSST